MANDFYQHSGWPGTRALNASASWRSEFGLIEEGFDKLPDVSTANLFAVTDGSALVGKTAVQSKVILSLSNVPNLDTTTAVAHTPLTNNPHSVTATQVGLGNCENTADADKPISTLAQAALDLKAPLASPALTGNPTAPTQAATDSSTKLATTAHVLNAFPYLAAPNGYQKFKGGIVVQWGSATCNATPGLGVILTYPVAFTNVYVVVATGFLNDLTPATVWVANVTGTTFDLRAAVASQNVGWLAIGYITPA